MIVHRYLDWIYENRFVVLFVALITFIFVPNFFPQEAQDRWVHPLTRSILLASTYGMVWNASKKRRFLFVLWIALLMGLSWISSSGDVSQLFDAVYLFLTFSFFILIAYEIVLHIYNHNEVDFQTVMSVLCGYLVLGVIGFFIFSIIHLAEPGAFNTSASNFDDMIYYTYITLTTIGYGDITPQTPSAKSAALILGIAGQFYTTVIIALIVGKFLQHKSVR